MLGFPILYCMGMRPMMFQLSGFCYKGLRLRTAGASKAFGSLGFRDGVCAFPRTSGVMIYTLHYRNDPRLWELWYIPYYG